MTAKRTPKLILATTVLSLTAFSAQAASVVYSARATLDPLEPPGAQIAAGDSFILSFTYDDAITDGNGSTTQGSFNSALIGVTITPEPGNTGTWTGTTSTTLLLPGSAETNAPSSFGLGAEITSFTVVNTLLLTGIDVSFFNSGLVNDTGLGQTIPDQIGGTLDPNPENYESASLHLEGDGGFIVMNLSSIPEPSSSLLLSCGLLIGLSRRKR